MTNLKQATLDICKITVERCVRSVEQKHGDFHFSWCTFLTHSWLACAAAVADILASANTAELRARSVFIDQNLGRIGGYTHSVQLIQVMQEMTLERDSLTDGQCAVQQLS